MRQELDQTAIMGCRHRRPRLLPVLTMMLILLIAAAAPAPSQAASAVADIMLSEHADAKGVVAEHQSTFAPTVAEIFGTALISGAIKGQGVTTKLFYVTRNLEILSSTDDLPDNGEVTFTFAFPKPEKGWPPGDYKLVISLADGATRTVTFQVK